MPPTVAFADLCSVLPFRFLADWKLGTARRGKKKKNITNKHVTQGTARLSKIQKELVTARPLQVLKQHTCSVCQVLSSRQHSKPTEDLVYTGALHDMQVARTPARTRLHVHGKGMVQMLLNPTMSAAMMLTQAATGMQIYDASSRIRGHKAQNPPSLCFAVLLSYSRTVSGARKKLPSSCTWQKHTSGSS